MYGEVTVAMSDTQFRFGVLAGGLALVAVIAVFRFFGSVTLPPKPAGPPSASTESQLADRTAASPTVYMKQLERDAADAGLEVPTLADMARALPHAADAKRRVLEIGDAPVEVAGLAIQAVRAGATIALEIENKTASDLAYLVVTTPSPQTSACTSARVQPANLMVIRKGERLTRVECIYRRGMAIVVTRVETVEVPPMSAYYLSHVPPENVGVSRRLARAHRGPPNRALCPPTISQAVRTGLEDGKIAWRDLVDFFARHPCQTYRFPLEYRAFTRHGERPIPVAGAGM